MLAAVVTRRRNEREAEAPQRIEITKDRFRGYAGIACQFAQGRPLPPRAERAKQGPLSQQGRLFRHRGVLWLLASGCGSLRTWLTKLAGCRDIPWETCQLCSSAALPCGRGPITRGGSPRGLVVRICKAHRRINEPMHPGRKSGRLLGQLLESTSLLMRRMFWPRILRMASSG
jgi:hypothetical protein